MPLDPLSGSHPVHRVTVPLQRQRLAEQRPRIHRPAGQQVHGRAETAQDGHRAGNGDLVVVDAERRDPDRGPGRGHAEDQHPPAPVQQADGGLDRLGHAGGVDRHREAGPVERAGVGDGPGRAQLARDLEPVPDPVHHRYRPGPGVQQQLQHQQAHGAGPDHHRRLAGHRPQESQAPHAVHRARQRFGHRPELPVEAVGQQVGVYRGHRDILGERAVHGVADRPPVLAQVAPPGPAAPAVPAVQGRVHRDPGADRQVGPGVRATRHHDARELVPGRDGVGSRRELPGQDVQVRAADTAALHPDHDLAGLRGGIRHVRHPEAAGMVKHKGPHLVLRQSLSPQGGLPSPGGRRTRRPAGRGR